MPTVLPALDGFVNEVETGFVRSFRRELFADRFFSHTRTRDISITTVEWREISDAGAAVKVTMEIPALERQPGLTVSRKQVEIPIFTRDLAYDGRAWSAYQRAQLDVEDARQAALGMAEQINDYLYFGASGKSGTRVMPGPTTGLLNTAGQQTVNNSASTNWNNPTDVTDDLAEAIVKLRVSGHTPNRSGGRYQLLMNPADSDLLTRWRVETDRQTQDMLPSVVGEPLFDHIIDQNTAYLIAVSPDNFDTVGPFSSGQVLTITDDPGERGLLMGKPIWIRHLTAISPRMKRPDAVVKITFDRA